jgi:hypothetical protein
MIDLQPCACCGDATVGRLCDECSSESKRLAMDGVSETPEDVCEQGS